MLIVGTFMTAAMILVVWTELDAYRLPLTWRVAPPTTGVCPTPTTPWVP